MDTRIKKGLAIITAAALAVTCLVANGKDNANADTQTDDGYTLVWEDEFAGTALNPDAWNIEKNGSGGGNNEDQYYRDSSDNLFVSDGTLKIRALKQTYGLKSYTSGRINSMGKAEFKYGRIEAKLKLPSFMGAWPAFWMMGSDYKTTGWPGCGEIDIMEAINNEAFTHGALHWSIPSSSGEIQRDNVSDTQGFIPEGYDRTQWHTYGIEWDEKTIQWEVDGVAFLRKSIVSGMEEFQQRHFLILNFAIGGNWPGHNIDQSAFPATMEVDYVRVYQKNGSGSEAMTPEWQTQPPETTRPQESVTQAGQNNNTNVLPQNSNGQNVKVTVKRAKIKKATRSRNNRKIVLTWKKIAGATGYNVRYSTSWKFAKRQTKIITTAKTKKTLKKLKAARKYYFKVRAYRVVNGKTYYGKWSPKKKVRVRK